MARPYRILGENAFYHITSRGNSRRSIYEKERDYLKFLEYLSRAKGKFQFQLYAYVLMKNHYHLVIKTLQANLSKIMHYVNSVYTTYYNKTNRNIGHLFQGRFKSLIIDAENYFKEVTRYIHLNPVKAKMVKNPEDYRWSSYRGYMSRKGDGYIDRKEIEKVLGMNIKEYTEFVYAGKAGKEDVFEKIYAGSMLGSTSFIRDKIESLKDQIENKDIAYGKKLEKSMEAEEVIEFISKKYDMKKIEILGSKGKQNQAKENCIYLLRRVTDMTNQEIGKMFEIGYTAVSKIYSKMEEEMGQNEQKRKTIERQVSHFKV